MEFGRPYTRVRPHLLAIQCVAVRRFNLAKSSYHGLASAFLTSVRPKIKTQRPQSKLSLRKEVLMKFNRVFVIAAFALAAVCASAVPASAQAVYQGSFTLPHTVRW